jgi:hypothetical protein
MNILIISMLLVAVAAAPTFTPDQKYDARWENYKVNDKLLFTFVQDGNPPSYRSISARNTEMRPRS